MKALSEEIDYLITTYNHYFSSHRFRVDEIVDHFAGLRVLPSGRGDLFGRSRESIELLDRAQRPRLISLYGGKLTAYRAVAERVIKRLMKYLPARREIDTRSIVLGSKSL